MEKARSKFPEWIYSHHLQKIKDIKFTPREIDIIAFLISGRSIKKISSFFSIALKTAENHSRNIMQKLGCNSREGIIDFIEKSPQFPWIKQYYVGLLEQAQFEILLKNIAISNPNSGHSCCIVYWHGSDIENFCIQQLEKHLTLTGIKTTIKIKEYKDRMDHFFHDCKKQDIDHVIVALPTIQLPTKFTDEINPYLASLHNSKTPFTLLTVGTVSTADYLQQLGENDQIEFIDFQNYYDFILLLLQKLISNPQIDQLISSFKGQLISSPDLFEDDSSSTQLGNVRPKGKRFQRFYKFLCQHKNKWQGRIVIASGIDATLVIFTSFYLYTVTNDEKLSKNQISQHNPGIRSDLFIPKESLFLNRSDLLTRINNGFQGKEEIKVAALVGIGGAGKTTLARQYARQQNAPVIWEINAETKESLINSFESFAFALATSEKETQMLRQLEEIKKPRDKEQQIIRFVKKKLLSVPRWFLIYDNVENMKDIQDHFPSDPEVWGKGNVIITSRDRNICHNKQIDKCYEVGELTEEEKEELFKKIISSTSKDGSLTGSSMPLVTFLKGIPSFPLDVSMAAYYLKTTAISYEKYLTYLGNQHSNFNAVQHNILRSDFTYDQTRHNIIKSSIENIIKENNDFLELLLLVSMLDSQYIPGDLLTYFKNDTLVDNFIFHLNKYSLIHDQKVNQKTLGSRIFIIHRCVQEIVFSYMEKHLDSNQYKRLIHLIINNMNKYLDRLIETEDSSMLKLFIFHYEKILNHSNLLLQIDATRIKYNLGKIYFFFGDYNKATNIFNDISLQIGDNNKNEYLSSVLMYLGRCYGFLGKYDEAEKLLLQSLNINQLYFPFKLEELAITLTYLGAFYGEVGKYEQALEKLEHSLSIYKAHFSQDERARAWVFMILGRMYNEKQDFKKALYYLEKSYNYYNKSQYNKSLYFIRCHVYLGSAYNNIFEVDKAKYFLERGLDMYETYFPGNYEDIVHCCVVLGEVLRRLQEHKHSRELLRKALKITEEYFPDNKSRLAWIKIHLGTTEYELKNQEIAIKLLENGWMVYQQHYGKEHIHTKWALDRLNKAIKGESLTLAE